MPDNERYDIFVSYAHVDNQLMSGMQQGWITTFAEDVGVQLARKLGRAEKLHIWTDTRDLPGHKPITDEIFNALDEADALIIIMSPGYINSPWCKKELTRFLRHQSKKGRSKTFIVEIDSVAKEKQPKEFAELRGYPFWEKIPGKNVARQLGHPVPIPTDPAHQSYYDKILDLCQEMADELCSGLEPDSKVLPISRANEKIVFLAEVTDDLESRRDEVTRYLCQQGFKVVPESGITWDINRDLVSYENFLTENLNKTSFFVQLLSSFGGKRPFGQPKSISLLQHEMAVRLGKTILQWHNVDLKMKDVESEDQRTLLQGLTVRSVSLEDFKGFVTSSIARMDNATATSSTATKGLGKFIYVAADQSDQRLIKDTFTNSIKELDDSKKILLAWTPDDDPEEVRKFQDESLLNCDVALLTYCTNQPSAVINRLMQFFSVFMKRKSLPLIALYEGPPPDKPDLTLMASDITRIDCRNSPDQLYEFLKSL